MTKEEAAHLEPDDTPRSHYIGPGSEYSPEGEE